MLGKLYYVTRHQPNGMLDNTFGVNGSIKVRGEKPSALALQPDGKLLISSIQEDTAYQNFALARYNINGTPDNTFGTNGTVITRFRNPASPATICSDRPVAVFVLPNGKIIQGGHSYNNSQSFFSLVRLNANGTADNTYGINGNAFIPTSSYIPDDISNGGTYMRMPFKMILDSSQRIIAATNIGFTRITANGSLDNTFGVNGIASIPSFYNWFGGAVQSDGKIVFAGHSDNQAGLRRCNANGSIDTSFDTTAIVTLNPGIYFNVVYENLLLKPNGQFMLLVNNSPDPIGRTISRINSNGKIDAFYGRRGQILFLHLTELLYNPMANW